MIASSTHSSSVSRYILLFFLVFIARLSCAQEGFYTGMGWNTYAAREQIKSADGQFDFTQSTASPNDGFLTQSLGNYGLGFQMGFRKNFNRKKGDNIVTLDVQYYYNHQNVSLESHLPDLLLRTKVNYNHGTKIAFGHRFKQFHPYLFVQTFSQNLSHSNSSVQNAGIIYDVMDDGTLLSDELDSDGGSFSNGVYSFLGGFGVEIPLNNKVTLNMEYVPMKHVEYGVKDAENPEQYYINNLVVNQLQVGIRYYWYNPFQ